MMMSSNGKIFYVTGPLWRDSNGHQWIPLTKASDGNFDVFFDLRLNKCLNKRSIRWWLTHFCAHYDVIVMYTEIVLKFWNGQDF